MKKKLIKNLRTIFVILFILILIITAYINIRGSYLEYKELGDNYISIFKTKYLYKYITMAVNFVLIFLIMYFAARGIKKGLKVFFEQEKKEMPRLPNKSIALVVATISSIIVGAVFTPKIILCLSNVSFEKTDLIFNLDISFYMFTEPLIKMSIMYFIIICACLIIYSAAYYILVFNKYFDGVDKETLKNSGLIKDIIRYIRVIAIEISIYTLVRCLDIVFGSFMTTSGGIQLTGAGITESTIELWGNVIFAIVISVSAFLATINWKKNQRTKVLKNILAIPAYMVCMFIVMLGFNLIFVNSNKYDKEKEYIERNISYTKEAYGINCEEEMIEYTGTIEAEEVEKNRNIIDNATIISKDLVLDELNQNQAEKGYYTYSTAGIACYDIDGTSKLVYVSPREILNTRRTYNSKTFEYTHGYGLIYTLASSTTEDGSLSYAQNEKVTVPQIYYGLSTDNTIAINDDEQIEYDYTDSRGTEYTTVYEGDSGLNLNFLDRLVLGIKTGNIKLAFSDNIDKDSTILINRNIRKRAELALSDVIYDENPYVVVDDNGNIYWVLDAYTVSSNYPYSTYTTVQYNGEKKDINYIRNSIKVIINAYDGEMKFYITDTTDPIAMAYRKTYPDLFEDIDSEIPESISSQFVYPEFLYNVQASILEEYHNTKSEVLYRGDDSWKKASYTTTQNGKTVNTTLDAYYTMVKDGDEEKIGLIQFYAPNGKQSLTSYLVGTVSNGKNNLKICKISSDDSVLGLSQLDSKIAEDENIQSKIDALDVTGAKVTKQMMIIPVENTLLYIEQIYQTKTNESEVPVLKKVIVASGNKVAIGDNINEAIENILSHSATSIDTVTTEDLDGIIQSIIKANKNLNASLKSGDWELIGTDIKSLQELIGLLEKKNEELSVETEK